MAIEAYNIGAVVTPSNTVDFPSICDAIWVGGAGAVVAVLENNTAVTIAAVPAGALLPLRCKRINSTGTVASSILALYQR